MVPGLRVLVSVALDADVLVDNHDFDVTAALLLLRYNRLSLVFANVEEIVEVFFAGSGEGVVHFVRDHFVGATLFREELAL